MTSRLRVSVPGQTLKDAIGDVPDGVEVLIWDFQSAPPAGEIDIVVPPYMGALPLLERLSEVKARLVQSQSIGYDDVERVLPPGHVFANAATVHETSTAELALALMLASQRGIPDFVRAAGENGGRWAPERHASLADRTVLLIGYGGVGKAIETRLVPFEVEVVRVASTARDTEEGHIHGLDELPSLLPEADVVVVGVPLNDSTAGLVDDAFLSSMKDDALLVNIARGRVADTDAIIAHASSGRLRFALDVTDPEPLPDGHPLFSFPNVLISPHVGGATSAMMPRMGRLVRRQIDRMLAGEEPVNVVLRS